MIITDREFSLKDVASDRIFDTEKGWRDRTEDERIELTEKQKSQFVSLLGHGCRENTKAALRRYIESPRLYPAVTRSLGNYMERLTFHPEYGFQVVYGQDADTERPWVREQIKKGAGY